MSDETTTTKKKRGRPVEILPADFNKTVRNMHGDNSERTKTNTCYFMRSFLLLDKHENKAFAKYFLGDIRSNPPKTKRWVMMELGKIKDDKELIEVARMIYNQRDIYPTQKEMVSAIRYMRLGRGIEFKEDVFSNKVDKLIKYHHMECNKLEVREKMADILERYAVMLRSMEY
jgi:hypothetical protein